MNIQKLILEERYGNLHQSCCTTPQSSGSGNSVTPDNYFRAQEQPQFYQPANKW